VPRILSTLGDATGARELQRHARDSGLRTFLVDEHTLETHPPVQAVEECHVSPSAVVLRGAWGSFGLPPGRVRLLVTSQVEQRRIRSSRRISMMAAEPGSTPGLPRVVRETRTTQEHRRVLDLYPAGEERALRLREESTRLHGEGIPEQPSSLLRFLHVVQALQRVAPDAPFDDRFALFDDLDTDRVQRTDARSGVTVLDGISRFQRYSRLLWMAQNPAI
jgi:hypothetical protein